MKQKAPRNRTLTIDEQEKESLLATITTQDEAIRDNRFSDTLIAGDTIELLNAMPDGMAKLIIADPPYNLNKRFGDSEFHASSNAEYERFLQSWLPELCRKLTPDGSLYLCGDWKCSSIMQTVLSKHLHIINRITWQRDKGRGASRNWKNAMEDIWFAVADRSHYTFNTDAVKMKRRVLAPYRTQGEARDWQECNDGRFRLTYPSNFWDDISIPFWSMPENTVHPTQKSEKLFAKLILASSNEGDLVLDPFAGSGTSAVVAKKLGRHYCAIEREQEYCLIAAKRLLLAENDKRIQGFVDGVFWERNTDCQRKSKQK